MTNIISYISNIISYIFDAAGFISVGFVLGLCCANFNQKTNKDEEHRKRQMRYGKIGAIIALAIYPILIFFYLKK